MALQKPPLTETERRAGEEYLAALRKLRFEPDFMAWSLHYTKEGGRSEKRLLIVSSMVDVAGPTAIYDLLFKAYDAAVTPKEIDPFHVVIWSPATFVGRDVLRYSNLGLSERSMTKLGDTDPSEVVTALPVAFPFGEPLMIPLNGIYVEGRERLSSIDNLRRFNSFQKQVERLAA